MADLMVVAEPKGILEFELNPTLGLPLGCAEVKMDTEKLSQLGLDVEGSADTNSKVTATRLLTHLESFAIEYRHVVILLAKDRQKARCVLSKFVEADRCWVEFEGKDKSGNTEVVVFLLTNAQSKKVQNQFKLQQSALLGNGQLLELVEVDEHPAFGDWYMVHDLAFSPRIDLADPDFTAYQLYPYNRLKRKESQAPLSLLVSPDLKNEFAKYDLVNVAPIDEAGQLVSEKCYPVTVRHDKNLPPGRVCLHETLAYALGLYPGGRIALKSTGKKLPLRERPDFIQRRRIITLVQPTTDYDVGYPVARLPQASIDVLGIGPGDRISVSGRNLAAGGDSDLVLANTGDRIAKGSLVVRCLPKRLDTPPSGVVRPNFPPGTIIPGIELDLIRREQLQVRRFEVVIVRPSYGALLFDEISLLINAVMIGAAASVFTLKLPLILVTISVLVFLVAARLIRKFSV